jgi:ribosomal protein S18 acetylase RimI-like enzyme
MVSIEPADQADTAELNRTLFAAFSEASIEDFGVEGVIPPGVDDGSMVETAFEDQSIYSIRDADGIIGGIIVEERPSNEMFLQTLWVAPEHQRNQVGSQAMAFLEASYPDIEAWSLETPKASDRNRRFYEKHGYQVVAEAGTEGEDVVLLTYRKEIT